ncbi:MAG: glycosyltransferase family 9 protein, partial [Chitinivibrionales bacterium]|nr:glycosyltransferase family 9 protein [Chitinivibrionales bacterium]
QTHLYPKAEDYLQIRALVERAMLLISPDTAIIHAAAAVNVPVIDLCTTLSTTPFWLPFGIPQKNIWAAEGRPTSSIAPARVWQACVKILSEMQAIPEP